MMSERIRIRLKAYDHRVLDQSVRDIVDAERLTGTNARIDVNICINYGARDEIVRASRNLARQVAAGEIKPEEIDEARFERELLTAGLP